MAEKRMFCKEIIENDIFCELPFSSQALYFHLNINADDDGFVKDTKRLLRGLGCKADDLNLLMYRNYVLLYDSGIYVITDWHLHNYLRQDRYKETIFRHEKAQLVLLENRKYIPICLLKKYTLTDKVVHGVPIVTNIEYSHNSLAVQQYGIPTGAPSGLPSIE